ncbi:GNAT family N-acetyltransferase [Saccharomonospora sp. NB11]|uniref:GNAT family N-acetyltransferase n=1 Tax=Saccharomonospora sp. NB11 TaxID=1642298 RepID=UPI0018D1EFBD|nr:GNAT family N-acetyltransferase [Saccharomonospora sp. NB11]
MSVEVLDPRFDAEPPYWAALRAEAGLRADWAWDVLRQQAWCARTPWYVTVLLDRGRPRGMVTAAWIGPPTRRHRFATSRRGGRIGGLDVRAPGNSAFPAWWFADAHADGCEELLSEYFPTMRKLLGTGLKATLIRQLSEEGAARVRGRLRLVRETEPIARLCTEPFSGRDDWLGSLGGKRRSQLRKLYRGIDGDEHLAVEWLIGDAVDVVELAELLRVNEVKHRDVPIVPLPQFVGYLRRLVAQPDYRVLSFRDTRSGRLLAAATVFDHPQWPLWRSFSTVPVERGGRANLYFHVFGELVRWSVAEGRRGVVLGKKMSEVKKSCGAELIAQYAAAVPLI